MSKVEEGGPIAPPPPLRLRVTIFSRRLLGLKLQNLKATFYEGSKQNGVITRTYFIRGDFLII